MIKIFIRICFLFLFLNLGLSRDLFSQNVGIGTATPVGRFHIKGSADTSQLVIDANFTQSNFRPLIKLRNNSGTDLMWIHSDEPSNVFLGLGAGRSNNQSGGGINNTFIGGNSGYSNTTGIYNTSIGLYALYKNSTGSSNTGVGSRALLNNATGSNNTAIGYEALENSTGSGSTAIGFRALIANTGSGNTASGYEALLYNNTGSFNTANGYNALSFNITADNNTAIGFESLRVSNGLGNTACGSSALRLNSIGGFNTAFGHAALYTNTAGSYNTAIGFYAGANKPANTSNHTDLGYYAGWIAGNSNEIEIGNTSVSWIGGNVGWGTYSDKRIKDNIQSNVPGLLFINKLNPVTYNLNIHRQNEMCGIKDSAQWDGKYDIEKITQTGFLAQEVEAAAKESGYDFNGVRAPHGNAKLYSIKYAAFVVPLVKAVQELANQNDELLKQVYEQKKQYEALVKRVEKLESFLDSKK